MFLKAWFFATFGNILTPKKVFFWSGYPNGQIKLRKILAIGETISLKYGCFQIHFCSQQNSKKIPKNSKKNPKKVRKRKEMKRCEKPKRTKALYKKRWEGCCLRRDTILMHFVGWANVLPRHIQDTARFLQRAGAGAVPWMRGRTRTATEGHCEHALRGPLHAGLRLRPARRGGGRGAGGGPARHGRRAKGSGPGTRHRRWGGVQGGGGSWRVGGRGAGSGARRLRVTRKGDPDSRPCTL